MSSWPDGQHARELAESISKLPVIDVLLNTDGCEAEAVARELLAVIRNACLTEAG